MALLAHEKADMVSAHGSNPRDTGAVEVQIGLMTERINQLTEHFKVHKHDHHGRRGLYRLVAQRRRMLNYVKRKDIERYRSILSTFNLRK